ncbi:MAG: helix-turn-helix transcriptional regulator [Burkholderiales bacterium]
MPPVTVTPSAASFHRRALGLTQAALAQAAGVSVSYIKQFESERLRPSAQFLRKLAAYFEDQEVPAEKLALVYSRSGEVDHSPRARPGRIASMATVPQVEERQCFFVAKDIPDSLLDALMSRWERNEERLRELWPLEVHSGLLSKYSDESEKALQEVFALLAENFVIFKLLTGWELLAVGQSVNADSVAGVMLSHYSDVIQLKRHAPLESGAEAGNHAFEPEPTS